MINKKSSGVDGLEGKLNGAAQQAVREMVQALPDDTLSMAWRSSLNEKLLEATAKQRKRRRLIWVLRPALGLSLATVFALVVMFHPVPHNHAKQVDLSVETAILKDQHNSVLENEVSSAGLNSDEVTTEENPQDPDDGLWSDSDAQSL